MKEKYKAKPYKHQAWPKMFYHPVDGSYVTCESKADVPEGFVSSLAECENTPMGEPVPCMNYTVPEIVDEDDDDGDGGDDDNDDEGEDDPVSLEDLKLTRKEAIKLLEEEDIDFKKNAKNAVIAGLVSELLKEE